MTHLLSHLSLLLLLVESNHAAELTGRDYWNSVLPKTPMPNAISVHLDSGKQISGSKIQDPGARIHTEAIKINYKIKYKEGASQTQIHPDAKKNYGNNNINYTKGHGDNFDPNDATFFLEQELHSGKKMTQDFTQTTPNAHLFIPRSEAKKLPFSSSKLSDILNHFKITKDSYEADLIKQTLTDCEDPAAEGEKKYCATSLESMVDFAISSLKTHDVRSLSTNVNPKNAPKQEYTIIKSKLLAKNKLVVCHAEPYAYAVFYCHMIKSTAAYMVNLVGKDGDQAAAIAVCHEDTSSWNPHHFAFQLLKVQPGTVPVCHFLVTSTAAWIRAM